MTDTTAINKPTNTPVQLPIQKKVQNHAAGEPYRETRLGSSSPLYDTYEKNGYGVGSVTTNPK